MKKFLVSFLVFVFIITVFSGISIEKVFGDIEIRGVSVSPSTIDTLAQYTIYIVLHKDLNRGENLYIKFPLECTVPQTINKELVEIAGYKPSVVTVSGNTVVLTLSEPLFENQGAGTGGLPVVFSLLSGIKNPPEVDIYYIDLWTSAEPNHSIFSVLINSGSGKLVSGVDAQCNPYEGGLPAEYSLSFEPSYQGTLYFSDGDYIDIIFPKETIFPVTPEPEKILINSFYCKKVEITSNMLRVYIPDSLGFVYNKCNILILKDFGIRNTLLPGYYTLKVSTSRDTGVALSNILEITGTKVNSAKLIVTPTIQGANSEFSISFKTSINKKLIRNQDTIFIEFPGEIFLPSKIEAETIKINNVPCSNVSLELNILKIVSPVNVSENGEANIFVSANSGIKNPLDTGDYHIKIYTTADSFPVELAFQITVSTVSAVQAKLSNSSAGQVSQYEISFRTGLSGNLLPEVDRIIVIFPLGTTIPSIISNSTVLINGVLTTAIEIQEQTLKVVIPIEVSLESTVSVLFTEGAGIRNPVQSGNYVLYVFTTKEQTSVSSNSYSIKNVPQTTLKLLPEVPDGLNGFYRTKPSISFTATSAIDPNPLIYYYFDGNSPSTFTGTAIVVPEGIHMLYYYAVDKEDHKEEVRSLQIKVDTIPPQIVVIFPQDNSVLNSKTLVVKGVVDVGSTVKVNGDLVTVDGLGNFEASIEVLSSPQIISISATDLAGNSLQKTLTVYLDTTPPNLTIVKPVMFQQVSKLPLIVEGITEKGAKITVNGINALVNEDGTFSYSLSTLQEGTVSNIEVIATDAAGNSTKRGVSVKYSKSVTMILQVGNAFALINGQTYTLEAAPTITSSRTMVPLRFIGEAFGAEFEYEPVTKTIDITFGSDRIKMQIGNKTATVNGKIAELDAAPYIVNSRTLVPIRFISETFGAEVVWDGSTKTVTIIYPKQ